MKKSIVKVNEEQLREIISESINKALGDKYGQDLFNHTLEGMEITNFVAQGIADGKYSFVATLNNGQAILKGVASDYYDASISSYMLLYKSITLNGKEYKVSLKRNSVDSRIENEIDRRLTDGIGNGSIKQYEELTINESQLRKIINEDNLRKVISESIRKALSEGYSFDLKKKYYGNYQTLANVYNNLVESLNGTREQFYFFEELLKNIDQSVHSYENDLIKEIFFSLRNARGLMGKAFHEIEGVLGLIDGGIQFVEDTGSAEG